MRRSAGAGLVGLALLSACASGPELSPPRAAVAIPPPQTRPAAPAPPVAAPAPAPRPVLVALSTLPGWAEEDFTSALKAFRTGCGVARAPAWRAVCRRAREQDPSDPDAARAFFEDNFRAEVRPGAGLLTAYFAPEYPARDAPDDVFSAPVRPRPGDLARVGSGPRGAVTRTGDASGAPYPDRATIEASPAPDALAYMRPEDLFFLQIQGSGTLVFSDGRRLKAVYAADNGRPFVPISRAMAAEGLLPPSQVSANGIRDWLAEHRGPEAGAVMDKNPRYVFFNLLPEDERDPLGAAGVPLPAGRSLAVDPAYHAYGELFWIDAAGPTLAGARPSYRRLALALDTGSAIRGDVRADLYLGRGDAAGAEAGRVRHALTLLPLVPVEGGRGSARASHETLPQG